MSNRSRSGRLCRALVAILGLIAGIAVSILPVGAQSRGDKAYTIANYPVEARAQDAVTAKDRALADGQQAAFRSLLKRLVPVTAYNRLKSLRAVKAGDLIEGVSVRSERNSTTQYIANLDFTFSPQAVRALLRREGIPYLDSQSSQVVVVPLVRTAQGIDKDNKMWTEAWSGLDLEHTLTPVRLAATKAQPSADLIKRLVAGDPAAVAPFATEFRSDFTVVALAEPDAAARRLHVWLVGSDPSGPIQWKRSYRLPSGDLAYAMELAAVVTLGVLEGRWKAQSLGVSGGSAALARTAEAFEMTVEFRSQSQWDAMRQRLDRIAGVEGVEVVSLQQRSAILALRFPGGASQLADAVGSQGMLLLPSGESWTLRPNQ